MVPEYKRREFVRISSFFMDSMSTRSKHTVVGFRLRGNDHAAAEDPPIGHGSDQVFSLQLLLVVNGQRDVLAAEFHHG